MLFVQVISRRRCNMSTSSPPPSHLVCPQTCCTGAGPGPREKVLGAAPSPPDTQSPAATASSNKPAGILLWRFDGPATERCCVDTALTELGHWGEEDTHHHRGALVFSPARGQVGGGYKGHLWGREGESDSHEEVKTLGQKNWNRTGCEEEEGNCWMKVKEKWVFRRKKAIWNELSY